MFYKKVENVFLFSITVFSLYCSISVGLHWDATTHMLKGEYIFKYIFSFGQIQYDLPGFQKFFPGFLFFLKNFITKFFPQSYIFEIENILNLLLSLTTLFAFYRLNKILFGKNTAKISFIYLLFFPAFFGHSLMNPKDTVILVSFIWIIYYVIKYITKQDKKNSIIISKIVFFASIASSIRVIFIGSLVPFLFLIFLEIFIFKKIIKKTFNKKVFFFDLLRIIIFSYVFLILFWPEVHGNILIEPAKIFLETISSPPVNNLPGLLNGLFYSSANTPYNQILINFLYRTPEYILFIYVISAFFLIKNNYENNKIIKFLNYKLLGIIILLISNYFLLFFLKFQLYDNLRTYLYLVPIYLIIPSLTTNLILKKLNANINKFFLLIIVILFFIHLVKFFRLTPYQYTYINYLNGSFRNNIDKFEMDYLGISIKELIHNSNFLNKVNTKITICGSEPKNIKIYLDKNNYHNTRVVRADERPDYAILTNRISWEEVDLNQLKTCFDDEKYLGTEVKSVQRLGLKLSTIRKISN